MGLTTVTTRLTSRQIRQRKGQARIVCLTAYDCSSAAVLDEAGVDVILVGDSLGMTVLGYESTLPVTIEQMLHHTAAVARGTRHALVLADMPFLSYQASVDEAIANAGRFLKEADADAVKIEGGAFRAPAIEALVRNGIPVVGHIGLTPQSVKELGGYKVQGRKPAEAEALLQDARAIEQAGAFALVVECVPAPLAAEITAAVSIPTIGIGAGPGCDGQVLVLHDMLGLTPGPTPRFVRHYAELRAEMLRAVRTYAEDVTAGRFPGPEHTY